MYLCIWHFLKTFILCIIVGRYRAYSICMYEYVFSTPNYVFTIKIIPNYDSNHFYQCDSTTQPWSPGIPHLISNYRIRAMIKSHAKIPDEHFLNRPSKYFALQFKTSVLYVVCVDCMSSITVSVWSVGVNLLFN